MINTFITSWVNKYRVNRYQKSTIVLLNDSSEMSILKELRLVHKNTHPIKTFDLKRTSSGFTRSIFG
jgi:hypothetical protein